MASTIASILRDGEDPSMPALRAWLQNLSSSVSAASQGFRTFADLPTLNGYIPAEGEPTYAFILEPAFTAYKFTGALPWVLDPTYFDGVSGAVQSIVEDARRYALAAQASALGEPNGEANLGRNTLGTGANNLNSGSLFFQNTTGNYATVSYAEFRSFTARTVPGTVYVRVYALAGSSYVLRDQTATVLPTIAANTTISLPADNMLIAPGEFAVIASDDTGPSIGGPVGTQAVRFAYTVADTIPAADVTSYTQAENTFQGRVVLTTYTGLDLNYGPGVAPVIAGNDDIYIYSNSLGAGAGGTPPTDFVATRTGKTVQNRSVSSQRRPDILARFGSHPMLVNLPNNLIPASGSSDFLFGYGYDNGQPITANNASETISGWLGDVRGTISRLGNGLHRFTRATAGAAVKIYPDTPFVEDVQDGRYLGVAIIWPDRNSIGLQEFTGATYQQQYDASLAATQRAVEACLALGRRYLILGEHGRSDEYAGSTINPGPPAGSGLPGPALNGGQAFDLILALNAEKRKRYNRHFIDQREIVRSHANMSNPTDAADYAAGRQPSSLMASGENPKIHPNAAGNEIIGNAITERGVQLGFWAVSS